MAQSEDTELRDLVMDALEKNGSLAKIRALLRANIFLAFEDGYDNIKQNISLDNVLKVPEGLLSLSIVHEFLEYCNLKNTLFVYKSETRQEKEYKYEGQKVLYEKLNLKHDNIKEPVLVSILKCVLKSHQRLFSDTNNIHHSTKNDNNSNYRDEQNCTYIVHDDSSSTTSQSNSDNSSDEKTKLHLRLQLDNSDTDTSSDSARDKSSSEYIPSEHILQLNENNISKLTTNSVTAENQKNLSMHGSTENAPPYFLTDLKALHNSSTDSTSYVDLKPFNLSEEKLLNTTGIPTVNEIVTKSVANQKLITEQIDIDHTKSFVEIMTKQNNKHENGSDKERQKENKSLEISKSDSQETAEYSYDFTMSLASKNKDEDVQVESPQSLQEEVTESGDNKNTSNESQQDNFNSSRSSVSISDVADLISEKSLSITQNNEEMSINKSKVQKLHLSKSPASVKSQSNDSGDFSESPVPSLSNLSLDIHSE